MGEPGEIDRMAEISHAALKRARRVRKSLSIARLGRIFEGFRLCGIPYC